MEWSILVPLAGFAFATSWTPGPNNMMLAASGATFGWRATIPHAMGVTLGFPLMVFLIALGLGEVFQRSAALREGLAWFGCAVMLYLAWKIAGAGPGSTGRTVRPFRFHEAAAFQWINPKAWVMAIGISASATRGGDPVIEALIPAGVFVISGLTSTHGWALFGVAIGRLLGQGARLRVFNIVMGVLLAVSAIWLLVDR